MKRTPIALAAVLLAALSAPLLAQQDPRYQSYLLSCQMLKKSQVVQDNTALEKVDYALYQRQQMLKKQFPDPVDPDRDADGCLYYAAWLKLNPPATATGTAKPAAKKSTAGAKTKSTAKPAPTKTVQTTPTQETPTQTAPTQETPTQTAPTQTAPTQTTPTQTTPKTDVTETPVKSKMGPPTEEEWLLQNKSSQDLLLLNKEGGSTKNSPTLDGSQDQSGVVKVDGKKGGKKKLFDFSKERKKKSADVPNLAAGPDATKPPEHKRTLVDKLLGRNKEPTEQGNLEGQAGPKKAEDFGNMMGGAKFAAYSGLLAALFLTGPGALAGIILFAALGFFTGYWVTKKNG